MLHIVRTWTETSRRLRTPGYAAIWTDAEGSREMMISPVMVSDHMPAGVIEGLDKVMSLCVHFDSVHFKAIEYCTKAMSSHFEDSNPPDFTNEFYKRRSQLRRELRGMNRNYSPFKKRILQIMYVINCQLVSKSIKRIVSAHRHCISTTIVSDWMMKTRSDAHRTSSIYQQTIRENCTYSVRFHCLYTNTYRHLTNAATMPSNFQVRFSDIISQRIV